MRVSDEPKPSQNGSAKDSTQNGPMVPDRTVKPAFSHNTPAAKHEPSQTPSEASAGTDPEEKEQRESREREEREERDRRRKEEEEERGRQDKKKLERQKAEEEDKEGRRWDEKERRGKEQSSDTPSKSMSLDSPAPNHLVSEIKVSAPSPANRPP